MKVAIAGAGLCGLAIACKLYQSGIDVTVLEANKVAGGRVQPVPHDQHDFGPSWVWPYAQPAVAKWLATLDVQTFAQFDSGDALVDRHPNEEAVRQLIPAQHGMARVVGGTCAIVQALLDKLPNDVVRYQHCVTSCDFGDSTCRVDVSMGTASETMHCHKLIIALPPRIAVPLLPAREELADVVKTMQQTPTWMAQHAKVVIRYDDAFWRENGLSGRVASQVGPLAEIHDHCGPDGTPAALFGFVGLSAAQRLQMGNDVLNEAVHQQLMRCFGNNSPAPRKIEVKDWAREKFISTSADLAEPVRHPSVASDLVRQPWCKERLWFAGSETSAVSPGLIDGAFARADEVANAVVNR